MNSFSSNNDYSVKNMVLGTAGAVVGWESETYLRRIYSIPVGMCIRKNFKNKIKGGSYKEYVETAIAQNHLKNKIKVLDLNASTVESVKKELGIRQKKTEPSIISKAIVHILRGKSSKYSSFNRTLNGNNAYFSPRASAIVCNFEKFGSPVFHELQHKLNKESKNPLIKTLTKIRAPLSFFGTLAVSGIALCTDKKEAGEKQNINDKIKNNCGFLSTLCVLPLTAEEFIANIKGTKIAEKAGVTGDLLKKVKECHKMSMIGYACGAIATGLAAWSGNKIRDLICANKTPKVPQQFAVNRQM